MWWCSGVKWEMDISRLRHRGRAVLKLLRHGMARVLGSALTWRGGWVLAGEGVQAFYPPSNGC